MFIDTHAHLYVDDYKDDLHHVVQQSKSNNVAKVILPNIDESTIVPLNKLTQD